MIWPLPIQLQSGGFDETIEVRRRGAPLRADPFAEQAGYTVLPDLLNEKGWLFMNELRS